MMIRIIKHGKVRQCTCYNCGCIFTYEKEDMQYHIIVPNEEETYVVCPDCEERNLVRE